MRGLLLLLLPAFAMAANPPVTFTFNAGVTCAGECLAGGIQIRAVTTDSAGNTYLTGNTNLATLPVTPNAIQSSLVNSVCPGTPMLPLRCNDAFLIKLDPTGAVLYATYLGGSGDDYGYAVALDPQGNIYVAGASGSGIEDPVVPFPVTPGAAFTSIPGEYSAFVAKITPDGRLGYSTLLPVIWVSGIPPIALAVDANGNAYVALSIDPAGTPFPTTPGAFQPNPPADPKGQVVPVIAKLNGSGTALLYATYLSGSGRLYLAEDPAEGIAVDAAGNVTVAGQTTSSDFPVTAGAFQTTDRNQAATGFVAKLNANGTGLIYSTFLGGSVNDSISALRMDSQGGAYVLGISTSPDFPLTNGAAFTRGDAFVTHLSPDGSSLVYSIDLPNGLGMDLDAAGNVYVAGTNPQAATGTAFVTRLDPSGAASGMENLGGASNLVPGEPLYDSAMLVAVAPNGSVVLSGSVLSGDFPGIPAPNNNLGFAYAANFFMNATVMNAADYAPGVVTPGEIAAIRGYGFSLAEGETTTPDDTGKLPAQFADMSVAFDEFAAPLLYVQAQQMNVQVPWEIAGRSSVEMRISVRLGPGAGDVETLGPYPVVVAPSFPGIFSVNNSDGTLNSSSNPAASGDFITLYGTGGGATSIPGVTGGFWPANPLTSLVLPTSVSFGGANAPVLYFGSAPTLLSGFFQVNVRIPEGATGPLTLKIGDAATTAPVAIR